MKYIIGIVAAAILGIGVYWYVQGMGSGTVMFRTAPVKRDSVMATIGATGTVEPEEVIDVGAQVAGQIMSFGLDTNGKPIDYGSHVDEDMVLAKIDDVLYQMDVAQGNAQLAQAKAGQVRAEADLLQMKAKLVQAQRDWERAQKLGVSEALAESNYDAYKAAFDVAKANVAVSEATIVQEKAAVDQADATLKRAQRNVEYCTIKSPVKGEIIDRRVNIGQTVVSSLNAPSLFLLAKDLTKMQLWVSVNEADVGNIHAGQAVTFTVDAFPGHTFVGDVNKVRLNATMTQNVVTYTVEVNTDNSDGKLLPYLTANVNFETGKHDNVLVVPNAALRYTPQASLVSPAEANAAATTQPGQRKRAGSGKGPTTRSAEPVNFGTVWVQDGQFVKSMRVVIGITDGLSTEIRGKDVKEGMEVIIGEQRAQSGAGGKDTTNPFTPQFGGKGGGKR